MYLICLETIYQENPKLAKNIHKPVIKYTKDKKYEVKSKTEEVYFILNDLNQKEAVPVTWVMKKKYFKLME